MFVQLEPWAQLCRKSHGCGTSLPKKQFPASTLVALARHSSMLTSKGWFNSNFRRDEELAALQIFWVKMLHGGALEYGSSNNRQQHSSRSRGIRCVSTSKVGSTPAFTPNFSVPGSRAPLASAPGSYPARSGFKSLAVHDCLSRCGEVVSHLPWAQGIGGSNPLTSTSSMGARAALPVIARSPTETMRSEHPPLGLKRDSGPLSCRCGLVVERRVANAEIAGSSPAACSRIFCPRSTTVVHRFRKPAARVQFSTGAQQILPA